MAYNLENHYAAKHASVAFVLCGFACVGMAAVVFGFGGYPFTAGCLLFSAACNLFAIWRDRRWPVSG